MKKNIQIVSMVCLVAAAVLISTLAYQKQEDKNNPEQTSSEYVSQETTANPQTFQSHLPVITIDTGGQRILKNEKTWSEIKVYDQPGGSNNLDHTPDLDAASTVKYRGNSSYYTFDKRQYRIEFFEKGRSKKLDYGLCQMAAHSEWVLNGPFLDRTLIRNHLMYSLARETMEWAPDTRYCELFVNGEYKGVYLAVEPITAGVDRIRLSNYGLSSGQTAYIVKRDRVNTETNEIDTYGKLNGKTSQQLSISYPGVAKLTPIQMAWITKDISAFEEALYSDYFANPQIGYSKYIDIDSFVDYYILNEFSLNSDAGTLSTYAYKELGGKLYMAVWDFNNAFDNYQWEQKYNDQMFLVDAPWFDRLLEDRAFVDLVVKRYKELRQGILGTESLYNRIDGYVREMGDAIDRNFEVWGYTFNQDLLKSDDEGNSRDPRNYEQAVEMLKGSIKERVDFLDGNLEKLYDNCIN